MSTITFLKISDPSAAARYIAGRLSAELQHGKKVLWLVPGGSSIAVAVMACKLLDGVDLTQLTATLTDERYGMVGHDDSNWHQLQQQGFILPGANLLPVLSGEAMDVTAKEYAQNLRSALQNNDYRLGFFGIGPDGHTAGILPGSPALQADDFAVAYDAGNFKRITMTELAIQELDEAVVYATGEAKWPVLHDLEQNLKHPQDQPAQFLKSVSRLTIFNDYKGDGV